MNPLLQIRKDSLIYGIGIAFSKGLSLILLPIYTRLFPPVEYALIEILTMTHIFLSLFINMGLDAAQSYYFFEQKKKGGKQKQSELVTSILKWNLSIGTLITLFAVLISPVLSFLLFEGRIRWELFLVVFSGTLFFQITLQSAHIFQLLFRPWHYLGITFFQNLVSAAIAIGLIIWLDMGIMGYFIGFSLGSLIAGLVGWWLAREYIDWSASTKEQWPRIFKFGMPLIPSNFAFYFMESSDRWILGFFHGGVVLGIYAVGFKLAMAMNLLVEPFRKACGPIIYKSMHESECQLMFPVMIRLYMGIGSAIVVLLTTASPFLVKLVTIADYFNAYNVVGLLGWKQLFYGLFLFSAMGIYKKEKTKLVAYISGFTALINLTMLYFFVPENSGEGAALAMLISFFLWNFLAFAISQRLWPIAYPWAILLGQVTLGLLATYILLYFFETGEEVWKICLFASVSILILIASSAKLINFQKWYKLLNFST